MKIVLVGPGGIGSLFAALLARQDHEVWLLDHLADRASLIAHRGISLIEGNRSCCVSVLATDNPAIIEGSDYLCICVKSYDTTSAVQHALPALMKSRAVVSLQNGMGNVEQIGNLAPDIPVICAATAQGATLRGPGEVLHAGEGPTRVATWNSGDEEHSIHFANLLNGAGIRTTHTKDAEALLWGKLVVNTAINPVATLWNLTNGQILNHREARKTAMAAAEEAGLVAKARGVKLSFQDAAQEVKRVCLATSDNICSMLQDCRAGKRTEIDAITGYLVDQAERMRVDVPINRELLARISER